MNLLDFFKDFLFIAINIDDNLYIDFVDSKESFLKVVFKRLNVTLKKSFPHQKKLSFNSLKF